MTLSATADQNLSTRIVAAKAGSWVRRPNGSLERLFPDNVRMQVNAHLGMWRVSKSTGATVEPIWEADSVEEATSLAEAAAKSHAETAAWKRRAIEATSDIGDGLRVTIVKRQGDPGALAQISDGVDPRPLGRYAFTLTQWPSDYVLGTATINGGVVLDQSIRGKDVCRRLYDEVERITGTPIVPHGQNGVPGGLTSASKRFWEKRCAERKVVGQDDPEVAMRLERLARATEIIEAEASGYLDVDFAVALANLTSWTLRGLVPVDGEGAKNGMPLQAWCVDERGRAFTSTGYIEEGSIRHQHHAEINDLDPLALEGKLYGHSVSGFYVFPVDLQNMRRQAAAVLQRHGVSLREPGCLLEQGPTSL